LRHQPVRRDRAARRLLRASPRQRGVGRLGAAFRLGRQSGHRARRRVTRNVVDPGLMRVGREAARRMQRTGLRAKGRVKLPAITQEEVASLSGLLGGRWRAPLAGVDATVDLASLDRALQDSWYGCTLLDFAAA